MTKPSRIAVIRKHAEALKATSQKAVETRARTIPLVLAFAPLDGRELDDDQVERLQLAFLEENACVKTDGITWWLTGRGREIYEKHAPGA